MKRNKIKISLFISILIVFVIRLLFLFFPIYSSVTTVNVPKLFPEYDVDVSKHTNKQKCINIKVSYDIGNDQTIFNFSAKSLKKQKSEKCIADAIYFLESLINEKNNFIDKKLFELKDLNNKIDDLIIDSENNKNLDKEKLFLINDYFKNINVTKNIRKFPLPVDYEIKTDRIKNINLFRYLFSAFILFFWISYVFLDDFKKKNNG